MRKRAQALTEYVLILGIVALALSGIRIYFERGIKSAVKLAADEFGNQDDAVTPEEDSITTQHSLIHRTQDSSTQEIISNSGSGKLHSFNTLSNLSVLPLDEDGNNPSYTESITEEEE